MYENVKVGKQISGESYSDYAYRIIRENITKFKLQPGCVINESLLAEMMEISRTPVHEAIARLKDDKLVSVVPRKESKVSPIIMNYVNEGVFVRCCIEPEIIKIASKNFDHKYKLMLRDNLAKQTEILESGADLFNYYPIDDEFHRILYMGVNKMVTYNTMIKMVTHLDRVRYLVRHEGSYNIENLSHSDHQDIYNMIILNSTTGYDLQAFMERHIMRWRNKIKILNEKFPGYFLDSI